MRAGLLLATALFAGCSYEGSLGGVVDVAPIHEPAAIDPGPVSPAWKAEYFDNAALAGAPRHRDEDAATLYFDWGEGAPMAGLPVDNFSARFTRTFSFPEGTYRFTTRSDDGVRVWVDDALVIDQWHLPFMAAVDHELAAGNHWVKMEYREQSGSAILQLSWPVVSPTACGQIPIEKCDVEPACQWFSCANLCLPRNIADPPTCNCAKFETMESCDAHHGKGCGWFRCQQRCLPTGTSLYSVCGEGTP
jgi:hypothetical protein